MDRSRITWDTPRILRTRLPPPPRLLGPTRSRRTQIDYLVWQGCRQVRPKSSSGVSSDRDRLPTRSRWSRSSGAHEHLVRDALLLDQRHLHVNQIRRDRVRGRNVEKPQPGLLRPKHLPPTVQRPFCVIFWWDSSGYSRRRRRPSRRVYLFDDLQRNLRTRSPGTEH